LALLLLKLEALKTRLKMHFQIMKLEVGNLNYQCQALKISFFEFQEDVNNLQTLFQENFTIMQPYLLNMKKSNRNQ